MKSIIHFYLAIYLCCSFSSCIPIELIHTESYELSGVVRNYITKQPIQNVTVIAEHLNNGFIKFCGYRHSDIITGKDGRFALKFEGGCGFDFYVDLKNAKEYDQLPQHQLVINDRPTNKMEADTPSGMDYIIEIQPYILLEIKTIENENLELTHITIPDFDLKVDSLRNWERLNLNLKDFSSSFDIIAHYQNQPSKFMKIEYDYFKQMKHSVKIEI